MTRWPITRRFSTKIHLLCDGDGHPLYFHLTPGEQHQSTAFLTVFEGGMTPEVTDSDGEPVAWPVALAGDKAYRASGSMKPCWSWASNRSSPSKSNEDSEARVG